MIRSSAIRLLPALFMVLAVSMLKAQPTMNIHLNNGTIEQYATADIDSVVYWAYPQPELMWIYFSDGTSDTYSSSAIDLVTYSIGGPTGSPWPVTIGSGSVTYSTAVVTGYVGSQGSSPVSQRGICWDTLVSPTIANDVLPIGSGTGTFSGQLTGLLQGRTYHARAYATNNSGTAYGNEVTFTTWLNPWLNDTLAYGTVMDVDGNSYHTITIGSETWMAEDLRTAHYANGDPISFVAVAGGWGGQSAGAWAYNGFDYLNDEARGRYYNWYAVTDPRNVCPAGWHAPSHAEFLQLIADAPGGGALKSTGIEDDGSGIWASPNTGATNATGFTALPFGNISYAGISTSSHQYATFWTASASGAQEGWGIFLNYNNTSATEVSTPQFQVGMKVRCLMD